jgi:hypothetical protein
MNPNAPVFTQVVVRTFPGPVRGWFARGIERVAASVA